MDKRYYYPDKTWKNVWLVIRSNRKSKIVLSCKACPQGVSPKRKTYLAGISFLGFTIGFILPIALCRYVLPEGWSKTLKSLVSILVLISACVPIASILALISFHFPKLWVPAAVSQSD